jgi:hypothetical protein
VALRVVAGVLAMGVRRCKEAMMATGMNPDKERVYVLKEDMDLPTEQQTRFIYKTLTAGAYYRSMDSLVEFRGGGDGGEQRTIIQSGSQERQILLDGLVRVENLKDEDGRELQYPPKGADLKLNFLSFLRPRWRREIANAILADTRLDEKEERNLKLLSTSA